MITLICTVLVIQIEVLGMVGGGQQVLFLMESNPMIVLLQIAIITLIKIDI